MIELLKYAILGIIQGITEPIPVSSSGHIMVVKALIEKITNEVLSIDYSTFAILTNAGSLIAITVVFRKQLIELITSFVTYLKTKDKKHEVNFNYCWLVVLATIPAGIMGLVITKLGLLDALEDNLKFLGTMLIFTSLFLFMVKDFKGTKEKKEMKWKDALMVGIFQMFALIPGISRSGATLVAGMFAGLKRDVAFTFSFMLYIPISIATTILGLKELFSAPISAEVWMYYVVGTFLAFLLTIITTKWFSKLVRNGKLIYFSIYCLIIGLLVIMFL